MADRLLPFGQITPVARPIGAFVQAADKNIAGPAKPAMLGTPDGVSALQMGSGGSVQGYNQYQQLATALSPFTETLVQAGAQGYLSYAKDKIEDGYYDELKKLKNQQAKAALSLQVQQEQGAANAAAQINQLQKVDPVASQLLQDSNPWSQVGRKRAVAQMAAAEVDDALLNDLAVNAGARAGLAPGSGELVKQKAAITNRVMSAYGLTGDELESQFYVVPAVNKAWETYTEQHRKLWNEETARTTTEATGGAVNGVLAQILRNGVSMADGSVITRTDPRFNSLAGLVLTNQIDQGLRLLAGDKKKEAMQTVYGNLALLSRNPAVESIVREIRVGNPNDPLDKRPRFIDANPVQLLEMQNKGLQLTTQKFELKQKDLGQQMDAFYYGKDGPGHPGVVVDSEDYQRRLIAAKNHGLRIGFLDVDNYLGDKATQSQGFARAAFSMTAEERAAAENWVDNLSPDALSPKNIGRVRAQADAYAMREATGEARDQLRQKLQTRINEREKLFNDMPEGLFGQIKGEIKQDMGLGAIKALDPKGEAMSLLLQPGMTVGGAMSAAPNKLAAFAIDLENLYVRQVMAGMNAWRAKNPGVGRIPPATQNEIVSLAVANARKSPEYVRIYSQATGMNPGEVGQGKVGTGPKQGNKPGPDVRGVDRSKAGSLPDSTVKAYQARPVMSKPWLHSELQNLNNGKPVSPELYNLARRANTSTTRYLLEQMTRFYPDVDLDGTTSKYLQQELIRERQGKTVSSANYSSLGLGMVPTGYNSFSPGSWLMQMIMPPAAAATLPPEYSGGGGQSYVATRSTRGGSGGPGWDKVVAMARANGAKFPELVAAQWALESDWGRSTSGRNNYFGQKGAGTRRNTWEVVGGQRVNTSASFMDFASPNESVGYLVSKWYQGSNGANKAKTVEEAARILKQQGYATDPDYVNKLLRIIRSNRRP